MADLVTVLRDTRARLAHPSNDFSWSSWEDGAAALREMDELIAKAGAGNPDRSTLDVLFAPTGPIQEVSLSSGWSREFLVLARRYDLTAGVRAWLPSEATLSALAIVALALAWLLSRAALACWTLATVSLILAGLAFSQRAASTKRRVPLGLLAGVVILVTFVLPIWGTHHGEPPPLGKLGGDTHSHPIWQLGHVH